MRRHPHTYNPKHAEFARLWNLLPGLNAMVPKSDHVFVSTTHLSQEKRRCQLFQPELESEGDE